MAGLALWQVTPTLDRFKKPFIQPGHPRRAVSTPEEGTAVAILIEKHVRIRETSDFEARLKALEERFGHGESR
jgi:hypothetical protein